MEGQLIPPLKKNVTNEDFIKLWESNIKEILETGNALTGWNKKLKLFSENYTQKEMLIHCLVKIKSIQDDRFYSVQYPNEKSKVLRVKYIEEDEDKFLSIEEIELKADQLILETNG